MFKILNFASKRFILIGGEICQTASMRVINTVFLENTKKTVKFQLFKILESAKMKELECQVVSS